MRLVTDTKLVQQGQLFGKITSFAGLAILIGGLIIAITQRSNIEPLWIGAIYGSLILGFILSNIGIFLANRWVREPRADQALDKELRGYDDRFALYNYTLPASHVLLMPTGVVVFLVKRQEGVITCEKDRWRQRLTIARALRFLTEEGLGNPTKEAQHEAALMRRFVQERVPEGYVPVNAAIVFTAPPEKLKLKVTNSSLPVLRLGEVKGFVRKLAQGKPLPPETARKLAQVFDEAAAR